MIVIAAVAIVLAAIAAVAAVVMGRDATVHLSGFGLHVTTTVLWVFVAGAVAMLLLMIGLAALRRGMRRQRAKRRELRELRREQAQTSAADSRTGTHAADDPVVDVRDPARAAPDEDPSTERRYVPGDGSDPG
jgi:uncharacterized membrane protein